MNLAELGRLAGQLEWDMLAGMNTTYTATSDASEQTTHHHTIPGPALEPSLFSQYPKDDMQPRLLQNPDNNTTASSIIETPPISDHELPAGSTIMWDLNTLDTLMVPELFASPLDTTPEWSVMGDWRVDDSHLATAWNWCFGDLEQEHPLRMACTASAETRFNSAPRVPTRATSSPSNTTTEHLACSFCTFTAVSITKLKTHTNKHTRPFRCTAPSCAYATAEKRSLQRHMLAKAKFDEGHRLAAEGLGVREVKYRCSGVGCDYVTIREDNLKRHVGNCPARAEGGVLRGEK